MKVYSTLLEKKLVAIHIIQIVIQKIIESGYGCASRYAGPLIGNLVETTIGL